MLEPVTCKILCPKTVTKDQAAFINARIKENYMVNWLVDGLPVGYSVLVKPPAKEYTIGFPLGNYEGESVSLNNHYSILINYHHNTDKDVLRVVGIEVQPDRYEK